MISLQDITKTYGKGDFAFQALKGITMDIQKGEFVAIMGPSGSGKSTLMNILGALDTATTGTYTLHGQQVEKMGKNQLADFRNKEVGFIFQQFNLLPKTSVYDNVALPGVYGEKSNLDKSVKKVLKAVGLADKINNKSNQLSGGQIQRVAIARALIMEPSIIMADEPTGNLDTKTANEIMHLISEIHQEGNTVILVTHEEDIAAYAERKIYLRDGLIESDEATPKKKK